MRYIGSKASTLIQLTDIIKYYMPIGIIGDPFGGVAVVGSHFKKMGYTIITGDTLKFAHYFQIAKVVNNDALNINEIFNNCLEDTPIEEGWFTMQYSLKRNFFTMQNAKNIQAHWNTIIKLDRYNLINQTQKAILLASLIESMDKVANTAGTYYAYLKTFTRKALNPFCFKIIEPTIGTKNCISENVEATELTKKYKFDILYLDPPYNSRNYSRYYHLPETIANCKSENTKGKAGIPSERNFLHSNFYSKENAKNELMSILENSDFKILVFHYRDDGVLSSESLENIFSNFGKVKQEYIDSLSYTNKAQSNSRITKHHIFIVHA